MRPLACLLLLAVLVPQTRLLAQEAAQSFEAPIPGDMRSPEFPPSALSSGSEGWVTFNFMVDATGKAFEPTVVGSAGPESLENAALRALQRSRFEPARLDGEAVEGSLYFTYRFVLDGAALTASPSFQRDYRRMLGYIESSDREAADKLIASLTQKGTKTNTEHALFDLTRFAYSEKFNNDQLEQLEYLESALMFESLDTSSSGGYLPESFRDFARRRLFILQANNGRYVEAMNTFVLMRDSGTDTSPFENTVQQISELGQDDSFFTVRGTTDDNGFWSLLLLKPGLFIDNLGNRISEFRLRCRNKYRFFSFQEGAQYMIPESWGTCSLEVLGDANTSFEVTQFRSSE